MQKKLEKLRIFKIIAIKKIIHNYLRYYIKSLPFSNILVLSKSICHRPIIQTKEKGLEPMDF